MVGIFQQPGDRGVSCFMQSDGASFCFRCNLGFLFQTTDDAVYRIQEVLFAYEFLSVAGSDQCSLIAYIGNIRTRESGVRRASKSISTLSFILIGRKCTPNTSLRSFKSGRSTYLTVKTSCTEQCLVEYVYTGW